MRIVVSILLFIALSFHLVVQLSIVTWYEVNKDYIAKNLCVNRNKPELKCCGKCYLKKQLNKADQQTDDKQAPTKNSKLSIEAFVIPVAVHFQTRYTKDTAIFNPRCQKMYSSVYEGNIFHPPSVLFS